MKAPRSIAPKHANCQSLRPESRGVALLLFGALLSFGCARRLDAPLHSSPSVHAASSSSTVRISTAAQEADSYWSSTYGNPRPKLTETISLGTSNLPTSEPPPLTSSLSSETTLPGSSSVAQANATAIVVVPGATRWNARFRDPSQATRFDPSRDAKKQAYASAPQKTRAPAPPPDNADVPTKRTSIVAPVAPRPRSE